MKTLAIITTTVALAFAGAAAAAPEPVLPNVSAAFPGQRPAAKILVSHGIRFACFEFMARNGFLLECYATGRAHVAKPKPKPEGPAA